MVMVSIYSVKAQTDITVSTLAELQSAVLLSNQNIVLTQGDYNIESLPSGSRFFDCTGSNNTINLTDVYIEFPVGSSEANHFLITGNNNTIQGGVFENTYASGIEEITDYVAYNNDKSNLAYGADPHLVIQGNGNTVVGIKMTVRGSFPYGYGSMYGIGRDNVYGLDKRGGIAVQGTNVVIDGCELQMRAFGHGIYIQSPSNHTIVRNTIVEGDVRSGADVLAETDTSSLAYMTDYLNYGDDFDNPTPINPNNVFSLCEDGIRVYNGGGSVEIENCTVKKMRGGIRTYLASAATVTNSESIDCGLSNFNLANNGTITKSSGNFSYAPLIDDGLPRDGHTIDITIAPSPNAIGSHNLADIEGNGHNIVFHRTDGAAVDTNETRAIVIFGNNSTIINETEYTIILESSASGNIIVSCGGGEIIDNGVLNTVIENTDCEVPVSIPCDNKASSLQAECFDNMSGIQNEGANVGFVNNGNWISFNDIDLTNMNSIQARTSSPTSGGNIEVRLDSATGTQIGTIEVSSTGNWNRWETEQASVTSLSGNKDIYFVFTGGDGYLFNLDWLIFSSAVLSVSDFNTDVSNRPSIYPNPISSVTTIQNANNSTLSIYDINGRIIFTKALLGDKEVVDLGSLTSGVYFAEVKSVSKREVIKLVKE